MTISSLDSRYVYIWSNPLTVKKVCIQVISLLP